MDGAHRVGKPIIIRSRLPLGIILNIDARPPHATLAISCVLIHPSRTSNGGNKAEAGIDPNALLPAKRNYYSYAGSLTTPPCAETVAWMLLAEPIQVAEADMRPSPGSSR